MISYDNYAINSKWAAITSHGGLGLNVKTNSEKLSS